jgi:transitional endoplasmic reticulum ATPase
LPCSFLRFRTSIPVERGRIAAWNHDPTSTPTDDGAIDEVYGTVTARYRVTADERNRLEADEVALSPASLAALDADPGDPVVVEGDRRTVGTLGDPLEAVDDDRIVPGDDVYRSAGVDHGGVVEVTPTATVPASRVRLAPTQSLQLEGSQASIGRLLAGRHVLEGDRIRAELSGGSLAVTLVVVDLSPDGPATVAEETRVELARGPAETDPEGRVSATSPDEFGGLEATWGELTTLVGVPLSDPGLYREIGARPPNGVIVHGPAGSGKTTLVRALAGETGATLRRVTGSDLSDRAGVEAVARRARREAPTILLVETLATLAGGPDGEGRRRETDRLAALLDAVSGAPSVVVVGETDRLEAVDAVLRRGGRFDRELRVEVPSPRDRERVLRIHAEDLRMAGDVDLAAVADRTHGYVGADLAALVTEATRRAISRLPVDVGAASPVPEGFADGLAVAREDFEAALETVGPSALRGVAIERPDVGYGDVGGLDRAKREVVRAVEWPLRFPAVFDRLSKGPPTGLLLYGPPGTGKTMLARAVAGSTDANFLAVDGPELLDRYVGESERGVREVFERARAVAPSVVFFDEIDALASERGSDGDAGAVDRVVSQLLTELDGLEPRGDVVVIAATNRPDVVDRALLRPGRLEKTVEVPLPDRAAREDILRIHLSEVPTGEVELAPLVEATDGYTGSDLAAVVREAGLLAMEAFLGNRDFQVGPSQAELEQLRVTTEDLERAVATVDPSVPEEMRERYAAIAREFSGRGDRSPGA